MFFEIHLTLHMIIHMYTYHDESQNCLAANDSFLEKDQPNLLLGRKEEEMEAEEADDSQVAEIPNARLQPPTRVQITHSKLQLNFGELL